MKNKPLSQSGTIVIPEDPVDDTRSLARRLFDIGWRVLRPEDAPSVLFLVRLDEGGQVYPLLRYWGAPSEWRRANFRCCPERGLPISLDSDAIVEELISLVQSECSEEEIRHLEDWRFVA